MNDVVQAFILETLKMECDYAAHYDDTKRLRRLHTFLTEVATNYVRLRLGAIDSRRAGTFEANGRTVDGPADAQDMECVAAEIVEDTSR